MTARTISSTDIAALQAVRSVIADATGHPGQQAAIEAIDRLASATGCPEMEPVFETVMTAKHDDHKLPPDWYDGKPKRCPGTGKEPRVAYHGEMDAGGDRLYRVHCGWCDKPQAPGEPMPDHTFIPVRIEDWTYADGEVVQTFAAPASSASLLDFIALTWPTLYPGKPFEPSAFVKRMCRAIELHGADPAFHANLGKFGQRRTLEMYALNDPADVPVGTQTTGDPVSWYADGAGPIRQEFTWEADPWANGIMSSKDSRFAVGITRNGNGSTAIAFPLDPPAGKRREVTRLDVRVTYVDRDASTPGMLIVDDPHAAKPADPKAVKAWFTGTAPSLPAVQWSEDLLAGAVQYTCPGCATTLTTHDVAIAPPDCGRCGVRMQHRR